MPIQHPLGFKQTTSIYHLSVLVQFSLSCREILGNLRSGRTRCFRVGMFCFFFSTVFCLGVKHPGIGGDQTLDFLVEGFPTKKNCIKLGLVSYTPLKTNRFHLNKAPWKRKNIYVNQQFLGVPAVSFRGCNFCLFLLVIFLRIPTLRKSPFQPTISVVGFVG